MPGKDPSKLSDREMLIAHMINLHFTDAEIVAQLSLDDGMLDILRENPFFKLYQGECFIRLKNVIAASDFSTPAGVLDAFDEATRWAFDALAEVVKSADRDSARVSAAKEILDRARISPKPARKEEGEKVIKIVLEGAVRQRIASAYRMIGKEDEAKKYDVDVTEESLPIEDKG